MLNTFLTIATGLNALSSSNKAGKAADQQAALTAAEIAHKEKIKELYSEGSDQMKAVMEQLYGEFGTYDDVSVDNFKGMRDFFSVNRKAEELQNKVDVTDEEARDLQMLFNLDQDFRNQSKLRMTQGEGRVSDQDAIFNYNAPSTYDMSPNVDRIAQKFINARMGNAERAIDAQYAKGLAQVPPGMENSTLRVQLERSAADMRSQALNDAMLAGVDDALNYSKGVQELTAGEQVMNLSERKFGQDLISNASDYATSMLDNEMNMGRYGLDVYDNYNDARSGAIRDLSNLQALRNDAALTDYMTGLDTMNAQSGIFNDYVTSQMNMAASPYKFAADGGSSAGFGTALTSLNNLSSAARSNATDAWGAFGTYLDRYTGYDDKPIG